MLPSPNRLPKEVIADIMRYGARATCDELTLYYKNNSTAPRFAFVVSTKIDKRATSRNRIRRILSESVRHMLTRIAPIDGLITVRKNIATLSQTGAEAMVTSLLLKAHLI